MLAVGVANGSGILASFACLWSVDICLFSPFPIRAVTSSKRPLSVLKYQ
jgi:hypothetical protein